MKNLFFPDIYNHLKYSISIYKCCYPKAFYITNVYSCLIKMPVKYGKWEMCWSGTQHYFVNGKTLCGADVIIYESDKKGLKPTPHCMRCMKLRGENMD